MECVYCCPMLVADLNPVRVLVIRLEVGDGEGGHAVCGGYGDTATWGDEVVTIIPLYL